MGEINDNTRSLRINIPVNRKEYRTVLRAAKVMSIKPAEFGREAVKRAARQVLKRAGVSIRLDMEDFLKEGPGDDEALEEMKGVEAEPALPPRVHVVEPPARYDPSPLAPGPLEDDFEGEA